MGTDKDGQAPLTRESWPTRLRPDPATPVPEPVADPELIDTVLRRLGPDPVAWASQVGAEAAARISDGIASFVNDPTLRAGTESITLSALLEMSGASTDVPAITEDARRNISRSATAGVTFDELLNGIRLGHASMSEAFLAACEQLVPPEERALTIRSVSAKLFTHIDRFARVASEIYEREHSRFLASPAAIRAHAVQDLLLEGAEGAVRRAGGLDELESALQYPLRQAHLALVLAREGAAGSAIGAEDLRRLGYRLARESEAPQHLVHPTHDEVWVWLGGTDRRAGPSLSPPKGVAVSVGGHEVGASGFGRTLAQAREVRDLRARASGAPAVWRYRELEVVLLLAADFPRARDFVADRLDGLLGRDRQSAELRNTLKAYLDAHSSPNETARRLHIARNTVSARVHKAAEFLGRDFADDVFDLHAALVLADVFGDEIFPED